MNQYESPYNHSFLTAIPSQRCKETLIVLLNAEKIAEAVLLYVFNIVFLASLLLGLALCRWDAEHSPDFRIQKPKSAF